MLYKTNMSRHMNIPLFIPHLGCPHDCIFCDQRRISGQYKPLSTADIHQIIEDWLKTAKPDDAVEIAFFGGSFTGIPKEQMLHYLQAVSSYVETGKVLRIRISTRPDYIDSAILELLKRYHVSVIELGVQSLDEQVLHYSKRGHTVNDVEDAVRLIKSYGLTLGIQVMPGLPGDRLDKALDTTQRVIALKPDFVRIYPAVTLKGTQMEQLYAAGDYNPLTVEEAVTWCARIVPLYRAEGIEVIKLGLHYSELLEDAVVAGPFHPAFGELVESRILYNKICEIIESQSLCLHRDILIETWPGALSKTLGHRKTNREALKKKYGFNNIQVIEADLPKGQVAVTSVHLEGEKL